MPFFVPSALARLDPRIQMTLLTTSLNKALRKVAEISAENRGVPLEVPTCCCAISWGIRSPA